MNQDMLMMLPGIDPEELAVIQSITRDMTEWEQQQFVAFYRGKRKDQMTMLVLTLIGFLGIAGIQRFVVGDTLLGVLYLITFGFCGIGTIIDIINIKSLTFEYNRRQAMEAATMVHMMRRMNG
jgi:TM2 domain-containing membrane protein YozV